MEKKAIITGIIHSIIVWLDCCRGSVDGVMVNFCCTHVDTKTSTGIATMLTEDGGAPKSTPRNPESNGAAE